LSEESFHSVWLPEANALGLTALEVASGVILGDGDSPPITPNRSLGPLESLRKIARALLLSRPCVVAFSGGRDSSALLAMLVDVARTDGLPEPIAVTARWENDQASDESEWQEQVIKAIGAQNWTIIRPGNDLDLLGHEATSVLAKAGLTWPAPAYVVMPMVRLAKGGVFITGEGGDEALGLWPHGRLWSTLRSGNVPRQSDVRGLALGLAPRALRRRRWMHNQPPYQSWLQPEALSEIRRSLAAEMASDPLRWDHYQVVNRARRSPEQTQRSFERLCALEGSQFAAPFLDQTFIASLAAWGGWLGKGDRTDVMRSLFSDLLPESVLSRRSKASFGAVFWGPASRKFAEEWDGTGIDTDLIDPGKLRAAWLAPIPVYGSALPLHAAWLYQNRRSR
jgi:asparagine synthetase B (glutamine-hydrolysing)